MSQIERKYEVDSQYLVKEEPVENVWYDQTHEYHEEEMFYCLVISIWTIIEKEISDDYVCDIDGQCNECPYTVEYRNEVCQK